MGIYGIDVDAVWPLSAADAAALTEVERLFRDRPMPADLLEARKALADFTSRAPLANGVALEPRSLGGVPAERNLPTDRRAGVIFFLHGGAFIMGSPATHRHYSTRLARESGCEVVAPDYRLAPEHPHPAAVEDSVSAWQALLEREQPGSVTLVGESAGGGLAVGLMHTLIDRGLPLPARFVLLNPWLDLTCSTLSQIRNQEAEFSLRREELQMAAKAYLGRTAVDDKVAFPLTAVPRGFPPGLVLAGGNDLLLDDALIFASLARAAGVDLRVEVFEGMPHVWPALSEHLEGARAGLLTVAGFAGTGAE